MARSLARLAENLRLIRKGYADPILVADDLMCTTVDDEPPDRSRGDATTTAPPADTGEDTDVTSAS